MRLKYNICETARLLQKHSIEFNSFFQKFDHELWKPEIQDREFSGNRRYIKSTVMRFFKSLGELNNVWKTLYASEEYSAFPSLDDVNIK